MNYYCTLFNLKYFSRGLLLHKSLMEHSSNAFLYILAFDNITFNELKRLNLKNVEVIALEDFEDSRLLEVKGSRSIGEYCWTCTPSIIKYCLEKFKLTQCTYLDADLYFFSNPEVLLAEMGEKSVLITEHRYTKKYDQSETSGKYCVQFMSFKNTKESLEVLTWWRDRCLEWCFARHEDGKFGDQKYLDNWTMMFPNVHELQNLGGGVAPWNLQQYEFKIFNNKLSLIDKSSEKKFPLVFFHFHALKIFKNHYDLGTYELSKNSKELIYIPYLNEIELIDKELVDKKLNFDWHFLNEIKKISLKQRLRIIKRKVLSLYNIIPSKRELNG